MTHPFRILVVCLGNVCRSPLAEAVLRARFDDLLGELSGSVSVSSAGVRALVGAPMEEQAATELRRLGADPSGFTATQVTAEMAGAADLVLTATRQLRSRVLEEAPRALRRTFTVLELAALLTDDVPAATPRNAADLVSEAASRRGAARVADYDVPDPIGASSRVHREVADLLDESCTRIAVAVAAVIRNDGGVRARP